MNPIIWIVFGGLVGWVATVIMGNDPQYGIIGNVIIGIVGSYIGGLIAGRMFQGPAVDGFDIRSFIVAVIGAVVLLFLISLF
jgi:uncharacterized membrane protein YeaQ/YmgE (transglycosylase-associated protein family)